MQGRMQQAYKGRNRERERDRDRDSGRKQRETDRATDRATEREAACAHADAQLRCALSRLCVSLRQLRATSIEGTDMLGTACGQDLAWSTTPSCSTGPGRRGAGSPTSSPPPSLSSAKCLS
eukprot:2899744-Rhodomonas_salina.3